MRADMRGNTRECARAFTLIEILMAMMILSIGLASVMSVFIVGLRSSRRVVDEAAAAVGAKAALARILAEDIMEVGTGSAPNGDGQRDFLQLIAEARGPDTPLCDWIWIHDKNNFFAGSVGSTVSESSIPAPVPIAEGSRFSWRCRASRYRGVPGRPRQDLMVGTDYVPLSAGRIPDRQLGNPDSDEMWRLVIEIYRDYNDGDRSLSSFETYVCMAHR